MEVILERPEGAAIGGEKREVTVLMTDLRGFTSLAEKLNSGAVTDLLNYYFSKMAEIVYFTNKKFECYLRDCLIDEGVDDENK